MHAMRNRGSISTISLLALCLVGCANEKSRKNEVTREAEQVCGLASGSLGIDQRDAEDHSIWMIGHEGDYWVRCVTRVLARHGYTPRLGSRRDGKADVNHVE